MDLLRWILLGLGLVLIGTIWLQGRRNRPARAESLFATARRRWARERKRRAGTTAGGAGAADPGEGVGPDRAEPDLGFDPDEFDELFDRDRAPTEARSDSGAATAAHDRADHRSASAGAGRGGTAKAAGRSGDADARSTPPPAREAGPAADATPDPPARKTASTPDRGGDRTDAPGEGERIVALFVVAANGERLAGGELRAAFAGLGLEHGELDIFHRLDEADRIIFSVANAAEPGTFDPATMDDMETPGVALFARLPGPCPATEAFDEMLDAAHKLAHSLGARALDSRQSTLTRQTEQALRDELLEYEHHVARIRKK